MDRKMLAGAAVLATVLCAAPADASPALAYRVSATHPASHILEVQLVVPPAYGCPDLALAAWTPGGYTIMHNAGRLLDLKVTAADGSTLPISHVDLDTWRVDCGGGAGYAARYRVWASAPSNPYSTDLEGNLLFANAVAVLAYLPEHMDAPAELEVVPPDGWPVVCSLPSATNTPDRFRAADWNDLADASFAAAPGLTVVETRAGGTRVRLALTRKPDEGVDLAAVADAHRRLVEAGRATFGSLPFADYLFLYKVGPTGSRGGLEHAYCTAMGIPESALASTTALLDQIGLAGHEFVHAFNVKRARPKALRPYDYAHAQPTGLLFVAEGWTTYYETLLLVRAGVHTPEQAYAELTDRIDRMRANPGNRFKSLADFSYESWIKPAAPFFTFRTYYVKGSLSGLDLDLALRAASAGRHSLDDLMRTLLDDPRLAHEGYTLADLETIAGRLAGRPMAQWFQRNVLSPGYLDLAPGLATVGLTLTPAENPPASASGIALGDPATGPGATVRWTEPSSPGEAAGLGAGDLLLAVAGRTGDRAALEGALAALPVGSPATLTVVRSGRVLELTLVPEAPDPQRLPVKVVEDPDASPTQLAARRAWLGPDISGN